MDRLVIFSTLLGLFATTACHLALADDASQPAYTYNDKGQITLATYQNGAVMSYSYDSNGNITSVVQVVAPPPPPPDDSDSNN